ncbi:MAG: amino acid adenylation domain-containing protein [Micromonosporaceae bacterium]|nr:amino acid adenylation domain-containing protein [Micromonosporaceae bacterium]
MSAPTPDAFPVASGQERMWFLACLEPELAVYNVNLWLPLPTGCAPEQARRALARLVARHEPLRTSFSMRDGAVLQLVHGSVPVTVEETDLRPLPATEREPEFARIARADAARPFTLDQAPLWRARLVRLTDQELRLVWICDHTVFDGSSSDIFVTELLECCAALRERRAPRLAELAIQYADYAVWQRERLTTQRVATELAYWRKELTGLPRDLGLPTDRPRPPVRGYRGEVHQFALAEELTSQVEEQARPLGGTSFMVLLAGFKALLSRWAGHPDIFVGCPMAGRPLPELAPLIGMFVNAVVLRTDLGGDPSFREAVRRVRATLLESLEHQELPFERIVEDLQPARDLSRPPLYQVAFNLVPSDTRGQIGNGTVKVDLALDLNLRDGRLHGRLEYATDLFDTATAERLAGAYQILLDAALRDPDLPISRLPMLPPAQRTRILALGRGPRVEPPSPAMLPEQLRAQAARTPDATAVVSESGQLSYRQLYARADRLAQRLRRLGAGPEVPVAVAAERSAELVVAVVAVLQAGAVLAPLDPDYPTDRLAFQLADSGAAVLLTQSRLRDTLPEPDCPVLLLDEPDPPDGTEVKPAPAPRPDNAAYLLYTSGSTGRPKGVLTSHRSLANRLDWMQRRFQLDAGDAVLHKTSVSFDVSLWELCWPLVTGARLVLARPGGQRDPGYLRHAIIRSEVTTIHFVPSMLEAFLAADGVERCRSLRRVICSGEELTHGVADGCCTRLPGAELHNLYGPTEAAIDVSAWACRPETGSGGVPIGWPVHNTQLHVLDRWLEPVPEGFPGELHIGGVQLARGYHGRPARTAAAFVPNPHGPPGTRLYRTGDLARMRPDGAIEFLGRADTQVKVHGVRVELGEIESALAEHPQVRRAVAAVRDDAPGGRGPVAYVDWAGEPGAAPAQLREVLARRLPATLLPQAFVLTGELPALPSGKVDRGALPSPASDDRTQVAAAYAPPSTPIERELCVIWSELLGRDRIGVADDFFELGGHSLLAMQLVGRLRERFGVELPLRRCFEITTIADHALEVLGLLMETSQ